MDMATHSKSRIREEIPATTQIPVQRLSTTFSNGLQMRMLDFTLLNLREFTVPRRSCSSKIAATLHGKLHGKVHSVLHSDCHQRHYTHVHREQY